MKRATVCAVMVWTAAMTAMVKADYTAIPTCTAAGAQFPTIDGDWIVWHDARSGTSNYAVCGYILSEPNEVLICDEYGNQRYASVSGSVAVWQDERNAQVDIYAFDLDARMPLALPNMPQSDDTAQRYPEISGSRILYEHYTGSVYNLFVYDMTTSTSTQVSAASVSQLNGSIDGTLVVWTESHDGVERVYWRDISTSNPAARVSQSTTRQVFPTVEGSLILWVEDAGAGDDWDIYAYDVISGGQPWVAVGGAGVQTRPSISGSLVAYQEKLDGRTDYDICAVDLDSGAVFAIATSTLHNDQYPGISGRTVVWQRGVSTTASVYRAELPTPTTLSVDAPMAGEMYLAVTSMEILWSLVDGDPPAAVDIHYSTDGGVNWLPVPGAEDVAFGEGYFLWEPIADTDSANCRVRVSDAAAGSLASAMSDVFTIFQCKAELTADLTGDCRVDLADFEIFARQWLTGGNPYDAGWF